MSNHDALSRQSYRERLHEGDVVYFVEGENALGGGNLTVKKGSVSQASRGRRYPLVLVWDHLDEGPGAGGVTKSPRELFTPAEVGSLISEHDSSLNPDADVDALLRDEIIGQELIGMLGGSTMQRLAEDELRRPGDPEY